MAATILCTGGSGFIGSHTVLQLLQEGYDVVVVDNLVNSSRESLRRVEELVGNGKQITFYQVDLLDKPALEDVFKRHTFAAVVHFAGLKAVGESTQKPLLYYHNNLTGTIYLLQVMAAFGCKNIVFSSSATVYGNAKTQPVDETIPTGSSNAYGRTKLFIEEILRDVQAADPSWNAISLRYFNPVGAHPSGRIGEDPVGIPNNLLPFVAQVAVGRREFVSVYGGDYDTPDGTGVRDYIHVCDLAEAHVAAVRRAIKDGNGYEAFNIGTGNGVSVLQMIAGMSKACGRELPYKIVDRRPGDVAVLYADATRAKKLLNWSAKRTLEDMCQDSWRWQSNNPNGFNAAAAGK